MLNNFLKLKFRKKLFHKLVKMKFLIFNQNKQFKNNNNFNFQILNKQEKIQKNQLLNKPKMIKLKYLKQQMTKKIM